VLALSALTPADLAEVCRRGRVAVFTPAQARSAGLHGVRLPTDEKVSASAPKPLAAEPACPGVAR
jgi:hypothetical protein